MTFGGLMVYVLYNTTSGSHYGRENIQEKISREFPGEEITLTDTLSVDDKQAYVSMLSAEDRLVIVGGDGTLNHFINGIEQEEYPFPIYCYAAGTGNDFINDVTGEKSDDLVKINEYIKGLPVIEVNGERYKFINGIGYGLDGWACEIGNQERIKKNGKAPNYTVIALKGLLYKFKTVNARVTVDGVTSEYKNVWMVPSMNGRYFGGGMMIAPMQDRLNEEKNLSAVVLTCKSRLKLLTIFPKVFKGKHAKHTDVFKVLTGKNISVEFDRAIALQIDGETVLGVKTYEVKSGALLKKEATV